MFPIKNLNVLVTGGAGFIGSNLVDALAVDNRVLVLDDFSNGKYENVAHHKSGGNVEIVEGSILDKPLINKLTKGVDIVYHMAVRCLRESIQDPMTNHEVNATGSLLMCLAARDNGVKRFVYCSSSEAYGSAAYVPMDEKHPCEPMTVYGAAKLAGEQYALSCYRTYGLPAMVVRPFNTYGPREHYEGQSGEVIPKFTLRTLYGRAPVVMGDGSQTRDFTYVTDTVKGIMMASACDEMIGQAVNIARGQEVSIKRIAEIIIEKTGADVQPEFTTTRPGDVLRHYAATAKARDMFGFTAGIGIEEGIGEYIDWFKDQGYDLEKLNEEDVVVNW